MYLIHTEILARTQRGAAANFRYIDAWYLVHSHYLVHV